jgi:hypothetical protein
MVIDLLSLVKDRYYRLVKALDLGYMSSADKKRVTKKIEHLQNIMRVYSFLDSTNYFFSLETESSAGKPLGTFLSHWNCNKDKAFESIDLAYKVV